MAVASQPPNLPQRPQSRRSSLHLVSQHPTPVTPISPDVQRNRQTSSKPPQNDLKAIAKTKPTPQRQPTLVRLESAAAILAILLGAAVLSVYGLTVYQSQKWSREYSRLQQLQRYERQLAIAAEMLKNEMAQQAENPAVGLIPRNPDNTIFLVPAPERDLSAITPVPVVPTEPEARTPLGY